MSESVLSVAHRPSGSSGRVGRPGPSHTAHSRPVSPRCHGAEMSLSLSPFAKKQAAGPSASDSRILAGPPEMAWAPSPLDRAALSRVPEGAVEKGLNFLTSGDTDDGTDIPTYRRLAEEHERERASRAAEPYGEASPWRSSPKERKKPTAGPPPITEQLKEQLKDRSVQRLPEAGTEWQKARDVKLRADLSQAMIQAGTGAPGTAGFDHVGTLDTPRDEKLRKELADELEAASHFNADKLREQGKVSAQVSQGGG